MFEIPSRLKGDELSIREGGGGGSLISSWGEDPVSPVVGNLIRC